VTGGDLQKRGIATTLNMAGQNWLHAESGQADKPKTSKSNFPSFLTAFLALKEVT